MNAHAPKISAATLAAAATRLLGTVILDLADLTTGPALYQPRLGAFATIEGEELGEDDGSLIALTQPGEARDLLAEHGTPGRAAAALNARLRAEWSAA